jgi:hypothetical protein
MIETLEERVEKRLPGLARLASDLASRGELPPDKIEYRGDRLPYAVCGYFLLNGAFRASRIEEGHWTEKAKIAALTAIAVVTIPVFRPLYGSAATSRAEVWCNQVFALEAASLTLSVPISEEISPSAHERLLDMLTDCECRTLGPYTDDLDNKRDRDLSEYRLTVDKADWLKVNSLITIFELVESRAKDRKIRAAATG